MASLGRARQCWERHGSAVRGASWQGRAGLGPVTAVAGGLVPQASAAPEQHFWPGLAGRCLARSGEVRRVDPRLGWAGHGPVTAVGRGLRAPAFRCPWAASARHGRERHGWAWRGQAGQCTARQGVEGGRSSAGFDSPPSALVAWRGLEWQGTAWLGKAGSGRERAVGNHWGSRSLAPTQQGEAGTGKARRGGARFGPGDAWLGGARQAGRLADTAVRVRGAHAPDKARHGMARPGSAWQVRARQGMARQGSTTIGRNSEAVRTQR